MATRTPLRPRQYERPRRPPAPRRRPPLRVVPPPRPRRRPTLDPIDTRTLVRHRLPWFLVVLALAFLAVGWRLVDVQALSAQRYQALGIEQRLRHVTLAAERGAIFDRRGNELALSVPSKTVWADPREVRKPQRHARKLARVLAGPGADAAAVAELRADLLDRLTPDDPDTAFVYLQRKVDDRIADRVEKLGLPGVRFVPEPKRHYPSGLAASVLGMVGTDNEGLGGLELQYDKLLSGRPGELVVERDPQGRDIPQGERRYRPPRSGADLILTVDQGLQFVAEKALSGAVDQFGARGGRVIVTNVRTGDVLAMANVTGAREGAAPGPDPAVDRNRAVTDVYEPGSTNKVITVAGAVEEGLVAPSTTFEVPARLAVADHVFTDHDWHETEQWSVADIIVNSSNVGAIKIGQMLGKDRLDGYLRRFGLGQETGLNFPGEPAGLLLDPDEWYPTSMGTVPIGNGLAVTPLQMLQVFVTIANDGVWRQPRLVAATVDGEGRRHPRPLGTTRQVVSPRTAELMTDMLEGVVAEGTGVNASIPGYTVAGKTGTARRPIEGARGYSGYVSSFIGFAPSDDPHLAAIVVLDDPHPIYGGVTAAPVFSEVMQEALRLEGIGPTAPVTPPTTPPQVVEEVAAGSLTDSPAGV